MKYLALAVIAIIIVAAVGAVLLTQGDDGGEEETVTITQKGSDTMLELAQIWAESYMDDNANVEVEVSGGGSGTGISALINGEVDVAQASRVMKQTEMDSAVAAGFTPVEFKVAIDGIAIITCQSNTVTELTVEQLRGIYNGTYTNWNQVGGADLDITLYGRQSSSGTYVYFQEEILDDENYSMDMNMLTGNSAIVSAVQGDTGGIGYVGIGYAVSATGISVLELKETDSDPAFSPLDEDSVLNGDYLLARYLYIYTDGTPTDQVSRWLGWIFSADGGQSVVTDVGFYALPQSVVDEEMAKLG